MKKKIILGLSALAMIYTACSSEGEQKTEENTPSQKQNERYDQSLADKLDPFEVLPEIAENPDNPVKDAKVKLGHTLYFDTQLSRRGNISCNSCHDLSKAGVDNLPTSPGDKGENGERNSPTVLNAAVHTTQFWDGRAKDVEEQAGMPILNPVEMDIPNEAFLMDRLAKTDNYPQLFAEAFPNAEAPMSFQNLRMAIAAFERKLITPSRYDRYLQGDKSALTLEEKKGLLSFINIGCVTCHKGSALGGDSFQKFGVYADYWKSTGSEKIDEGRFKVTGNEGDKYMFKVPSLRNIAETGPYFHDGSVESLEEAVRIMGKIQLDYEMRDDEVQNILAFLKSLSGEVPEKYKTAPM